MANWLRGPLNEWAKDLLNNKDLRKNSYLDFEIYDRLFQDHLENKKNNEKSLWAFLIFLDWSGKNQC